MTKKRIALLFTILLLGALILAGCAGKADRKPGNPDAIATVTNGNKTVAVTTTEELANAVDISGNTVIKLWKDIETKQTIALPYSCTIDFNGFKIVTKAGVSNALDINKAGEETPVTTLKNGTLEHYGNGLSVRGGFVVDNMTFYGTSGIAISLADATFAEKGISKVENSSFYSYGTSFLHYGMGGANYQNTDITLNNCTVVQYRDNGAPIFSREDANATPATIIFGENVNLYSYLDALAAEEGFYYAGNLTPMSNEPQTVTVKELSCEGLNFWSTENEDTAVNLLMIGNSFSYYYVQELYGMAKAAGVEINVTNLYEAGCYMNEHWEWITNEFSGAGKYQFWITNSMGRWRHGEITASYEALDYLDWDMISTQQYLHSGLSKTYETAMESCTPYAKNLFDLLKEKKPDAQLYWHAHWAFQVGHDSMPDKATQTARQNVIHQVSNDIAAENEGVILIPTGDAWAIARNDSRIGDVLCKADKYHDGDTGGGQYLNACVWLEVLTGKSCVGNTWRPNYALNERKIEALQQAAHQAVADMYGADFAK